MLPRVQHCCYGDSLESSDGEALLVSHVLQKTVVLASKRGWKVSQYFFIITRKHSHCVNLFLSQSSHWSNLTLHN